MGVTKKDRKTSYRVKGKPKLPNKKSYMICNLFPVIFFIAIFLFTWLQIKPALIGYWQDPVFLTDKNFFMQFVKYPGGIIDYISDFIAQFYVYSWLGALIITFISAVICLLTLYLLKLIGIKTARTFLYLVPAILLIIFISDYNFHIDVVIGILTGLLGLVLFVKLSNPVIKLFVFVISGFTIYYISGGSLLFYSLLCLFYILLNKQYSMKTKFAALFVILILSILLPLLTKQNVLGLTAKDAFLNNLPRVDDYKVPVLPYILHLFFVIILFIPWINKSKMFKKSRKRASKRLNCEPQLYIISAFIVLACLLTNIKTNRGVVNIEYLARKGEWKELIKESNKLKKAGLPIVYQINRALAHNGMLLDQMFKYPQQFGTEGIFISSENAYTSPMHNSDFYYEIGHVNESLHWAYEALSVKGPTPDILKRLAICNILKGEYEAALKYLKNLEKTIFYNKWARSYIEAISKNPDLSSLPQLAMMKDNMPDKDFVFYSKHSPLELSALLEKNPENVMAVQYLVAYQMLNVDLADFPVFINNLIALNCKTFPRYFEEALILFMIHSGVTDQFKWGPFTISEETVNRFNEYDGVLKSFNHDIEAAKDAIYKSFGDTYWYYAMYIFPNLSENN
jgi:hypothetical protein